MSFEFPTRMIGDFVVLKALPTTDLYCERLLCVEPGRNEPVVVTALRERNADIPEIQDWLLAKIYAHERLAPELAPAPLYGLGQGPRVEAIVTAWRPAVGLDDLIGGAARGTIAVPVGLRFARFLLEMAERVTADNLQGSILVERSQLLWGFDGVPFIDPDIGPRWDEQARGAATGVIRGNIEWVSPERAYGRAHDERNLVWIAGLALYELLTREPAHGVHDGPIGVLRAIIRGERAPVTEHRALPAATAALIEGCLALDADDRLDLAGLRRALDDAIAESGIADDEACARVLEALLPAEAREAEETREQIELLDLDASEVTLKLRRRDLTIIRDIEGRLPGPAAVAVPVEQPLSVLGDWRDHRPMLEVDDELLVDLEPVTADEYARFVTETEHPHPSSWRTPFPNPEVGARPVVDVELHDAEAYATWAGKRLPTEDEWSRAQLRFGDERLSIGAVWEWTTTIHQDGHLVRGGPWRDRPGPGHGAHASWENGGAADLGFRCVLDR
jgi:hypothetical protein